MQLKLRELLNVIDLVVYNNFCPISTFSMTKKVSLLNKDRHLGRTSYLIVFLPKVILYSPVRSWCTFPFTLKLTAYIPCSY